MYGPLSYLAIKKQTAAGTPLTPDTYLEFYEETMTADYLSTFRHPAKNSQNKNHRRNRGVNDGPKGNVKFPAYAKSSGYILNMNHGAPSTSGPTDSAYTHVFNDVGLSTLALPYYTMDIATVELAYVHRFWDLKGAGYKWGMEDNEWLIDASFQASGVFTVATVTTTASSGTALVISSTKGLTTSDTITVSFGDSTNSADYTIDTLNANETGITLGSAITGKTHTAGDRVVIKKASPSYSEGGLFLAIGSTDFKVATAIGSVAAADAEDFSIDFQRDVELRHTLTGTLESDRFPTANLSKGWAGMADFKWYHQDPKYISYVRSRQALAFTLQTYGASVGSSSQESLLFQAPALAVAPFRPQFGKDEIPNDTISGPMTYDDSAGYSFKATLVNTKPSY